MSESDTRFQSTFSQLGKSLGTTAFSIEQLIVLSPAERAELLDCTCLTTTRSWSNSAKTVKDDLRKQLHAKRLEFKRRVAQAIRDCPSMTQLEIAGRFGISRQEISAIATRHGAKRKRGAIVNADRAKNSVVLTNTRESIGGAVATKA